VLAPPSKLVLVPLLLPPLWLLLRQLQLHLQPPLRPRPRLLPPPRHLPLLLPLPEIPYVTSP